MSSVRSVLIKSCMSNIHKEIGQLEYWLNNLPNETPASSPHIPFPNQTVNPDYVNDMSNLHRVIDRLSDQLCNQHLTLNNILERLDTLEGFKHREREVFINQSSNQTDPWLDNICEPLRNEVVSNIDNDNKSDTLYNIYTNNLSTESSLITPTIIPNLSDDKSIVPDIESDLEDEDNTTHKLEQVRQEVEVEQEEQEEVELEQEKQEEEEEEEVEAEQEKQEEVEQEEEEQEEEVEEEQEEEVEQTEEEQEEEVEQEEVEQEEEEEVEQEEEEEEEGIELEEIEQNGKKYYKDSEGFIYSITHDEQPSENPIGYWKEKTQTIAFYKLK